MRKIGRRRSNACARWIRQFLRNKGFDAQLRCHDPWKTLEDGRGHRGRFQYDGRAAWTAAMVETLEAFSWGLEAQKQRQRC